MLSLCEIIQVHFLETDEKAAVSNIKTATAAITTTITNNRP